MEKRILFISALDFKEKSIQVIKKTPEAYAKRGWHVDYVVARDNCPAGNYFYEREIVPQGVNVTRLYWPIGKLRAKAGRVVSLLLTKIASAIVVVKLAYAAHRLLASRQYTAVYGYELHGVLATGLLFTMKKLDGITRISRFQGTFLNEMLERRQYARLLFNLDLITAVRMDSDLVIMTDDGTQGDAAIRKLRRRREGREKFWINGVDELRPNSKELERIRKQFDLDGKWTFVSVSRLVGWKRVDRGLDVVRELKKKGFAKFKYLIVGDGERRQWLERIAEEWGLTQEVVFVGSVAHSEIKNYLGCAHMLLSMYDSSNVGNPLLEAIRLHKPVVTLSNGDTGKWVRHWHNGLIYPPHGYIASDVADDLMTVIGERECYRRMVRGMRKVEREKLWTWQDRLRAEVDYVEALSNDAKSSA